MARSGWAYTDLRYFKNLGGPTGSVQFLVSETQLSGSQYFVYSTASNNIGIGLTTWDGVGDMDVPEGVGLGEAEQMEAEQMAAAEQLAAVEQLAAPSS